jgi:hypothetical protein
MTKTYSPLARFVYNEILKIPYDPKDRDNYLGDIGEMLIENGVKWFFWIRDFKIDISGDMTFTPRIHYGANKITKKGGIDLYLIFRYNGKTYRVYIEVKNWDDWLYYPNPRVSNSRFNSQILNRFVRYGKAKSGKRVLVIPKGYISDIQSRCNKNNITIVPLNDYLIPELLHISFVNSNLKHFLKGFTDYIDTIVKIPPIQLNFKNKKEHILDCYDKGMPPDLIARVSGSDIGYVYRVKSNTK